MNDAVVPTPVPHLSDVKSVACGRFHSAATTGDGRLYTWGSCDHGVLGLGSDQSSKLLPTQVLAPSSGKARAKHYRLEGMRFDCSQHLHNVYVLVVRSRLNVRACVCVCVCVCVSPSCLPACLPALARERGTGGRCAAGQARVGGSMRGLPHGFASCTTPRCLTVNANACPRSACVHGKTVMG